jgi:predicted nucleic acid-binding protein
MRPRDMADALIAATAAVHRKTVVTRNVTDFKDLGVALIDPWSPT